MHKQKTTNNLKDGLFLGFCAIFIVLTRLAFRLKLSISGHSMFFMIFALLLARASVRSRFAATMTGFIAGIVGVLFGMGKGGPFMLVKFLMPGIVIDAVYLFVPGMTTSFIACFLTALAASSTRFFSTSLVDFLIGMDRAILFQHALINSIGSMLFGGAGSLFVPPIVKKLQAHGIIEKGTAKDADIHRI